MNIDTIANHSGLISQRVMRFARVFIDDAYLCLTLLQDGLDDSALTPGMQFGQTTKTAVLSKKSQERGVGETLHGDTHDYQSN